MYTGGTGTLQSPDFPSAYPANQTCTYVMRAEPGHDVILTFDTFVTEDKFDYVLVSESHY